MQHCASFRGVTYRVDAPILTHFRSIYTGFAGIRYFGADNLCRNLT
ncbi:hypothetical protein HMPREF0576_0271 [Mobiluncus holmesii ATCC 35242]|uniref:Uncharacterized protein n=1 Tax=Mobiluncus holmesii ATCC 35242 TaxID=887899 RepID=E6M1C2_9ACTO|nr:hypothetical protein HMPREF0576_0271 [Mobiluncus holmesii ATCC 35242]